MASRKLSVVVTLALFFAIATVVVVVVVDASDPDLLEDFCVADKSTKLFFNGFPCKDPATVTSEDFTYRGLRNKGDLLTDFGAPLQQAFVTEFPGVNAQGMSWARLDFAYPGGLNVPHWHQRATELLYCTEGEILVGFVDTNNRLWSSVLHPGDVTVFPRGLMHFQLNVGKTEASAVLSLNSQNPGRSDVGPNTFGAGVQQQILQKALDLSPEVAGHLGKFFHAPNCKQQNESSNGHEEL